MQDVFAQASSVVLAAVRAGYIGGEANCLDVALWSPPTAVQEDCAGEVDRQVDGAVPRPAEDMTMLCAQGRALWYDLSHAIGTAPEGLNPALLAAGAAARRDLVLACAPPSDRDAMLEAVATAALALYALTRAAA
jgi:hypothetical protein